jgi:hypothetical protein
MSDGRFHEDLASHSVPKGASNRSFGLVMSVVLAIVGCWPLVRGGSERWWALIAASLFFVCALLLPDTLGPLNRVWTAFGLFLGKLVNPLVLSALFFLIFTPMALLMRAFGKDPLRLKFDPSAESYWIPRTGSEIESDSMRQQF